MAALAAGRQLATVQMGSRRQDSRTVCAWWQFARGAVAFTAWPQTLGSPMNDAGRRDDGRFALGGSNGDTMTRNHSAALSSLVLVLGMSLGSGARLPAQGRSARKEIGPSS